MQAYVPTRLDVTVTFDGGLWVNSPDPWFGMSSEFDRASDVYVTFAGSEGVTFGGFAPPTAAGVHRKRIYNVGSLEIEIYNFRAGLGEPDAGDPGMIMGANRVLEPGEAARLVNDPTGHRWLVNNGA